MAGYVQGGMGSIPPGTSGSVLNATGFDRLLVIHLAPVGANTLNMWINSTSLIPIGSTLLSLSSGTNYDIGPIFFGSTANLVGGAATCSGWYYIDEMRL